MNRTESLPPNKLQRAINQTKGFPSFMRPWMVDKAIGRTVKLVGTCKVHFEEMTSERLVVTLKNRKRVQNHLGQIHAAAMILLAETATGLLVGMNIPDDRIPLIKDLNTRFLRRTEGDMKAVATLSHEQIDLIHDTEKGETLVSVSVTDATGEEVIACEALWAWIPKKKIKG